MGIEHTEGLKNNIENIEKLEKQEQEIKALREELEKYKSAAEGANDGLWDWDFRKNQPFVSEPWMNMLGLKQEEISDMNGLWQDLLHPDDKDFAVKTFQDFIDGKIETYNQEFRLQHAEGYYIWVLSKAKAHRDKNGKALRVSGSHSDITQRKMMTDALTKSGEKYRNLFQNSLVAILRCEMDTGRVIEANEKFWELIGQDKEQSDATSFDIFANDKDRKRIFELLLENEFVENEEFKINCSENLEIWVSFSAVYYPDESIVECILKDISETRENLLELQKVNFELDSFVYHASHDLRSPLRSILGLIDLYRIENNPKLRNECIEKIEGSVLRLDDLVMELLSISRNDRVNDPHVAINFMIEINNSINSYYNASNTDGLQVNAKVKQTIPFYSDLTRVRIILNNLISNAIKYRSYHKQEAFVTVEVEVKEDFAVLKVEDNGEGIEESKLPHIFDMFYRATEKSEGSGLGLYIVKKVTEKLDAEINVESYELEGTTFTITIPNTHSNQ